MRSMKNFGLALILVFGWIYAAPAETYYLRADGTAANKAAATGPPSDASKCMSVATHNSQTFSDGDIIKLGDKGGNYTSQLIPPSSGSSVGITYTRADGESPLIDAGRRYTNNWIGPDGNGVYYCLQVDYPFMIYEDGLPLKKASDAACSNGRWYYQDTEYWKTYYKPLEGTPADHILSYDRSGIALRGMVDITGKSYLIIDGLAFRNGEQAISNDKSPVNTSHLTIRNCIFYYCDSAVWLAPGSGKTLSYVTLTNNLAYRCRAGFKCYVYGTADTKVLNINCNNNQAIDIGTIDGNNLWIQGIWTDNEAFGMQNISYSTFSNNITTGGLQTSFAFYAVKGATIANNEIKNNFIYNITARAFYLGGDGNYAFNSNKIFNNVIINSGKSGAINGDFCFYVTQGPSASSMNYIQNNTIYGYSDAVPFYFGPNSNPKYWTLRNNIIRGYKTTYSIAVEGNNMFIMDYNCWEVDNYFNLTGSFRSLSQIRPTYESHGMVANPQFVNPGGNTAAAYRLQSSSPCIKAGAHISLPSDYHGNGWRYPPSLGAIEFGKIDGSISPRTMGGSNYKPK
jgi:hypothetical protein